MWINYVVVHSQINNHTKWGEHFEACMGVCVCALIRLDFCSSAVFPCYDDLFVYCNTIFVHISYLSFLKSRYGNVEDNVAAAAHTDLQQHNLLIKCCSYSIAYVAFKADYVVNVVFKRLDSAETC